MKRPWTNEEKSAVMKHLKRYILMSKIPGKSTIEECIRKETALKGRTWRNVKDFCRNTITTLKRKV
jgi:hypothetical protein